MGDSDKSLESFTFPPVTPVPVSKLKRNTPSPSSPEKYQDRPVAGTPASPFSTTGTPTLKKSPAPSGQSQPLEQVRKEKAAGPAGQDRFTARDPLVRSHAEAAPRQPPSGVPQQNHSPPTNSSPTPATAQATVPKALTLPLASHQAPPPPSFSVKAPNSKKGGGYTDWASPSEFGPNSVFPSWSAPPHGGGNSVSLFKQQLPPNQQFKRNPPTSVQDLLWPPPQFYPQDETFFAQQKTRDTRGDAASPGPLDTRDTVVRGVTRPLQGTGHSIQPQHFPSPAPSHSPPPLPHSPPLPPSSRPPPPPPKKQDISQRAEEVKERGEEKPTIIEVSGVAMLVYWR